MSALKLSLSSHAPGADAVVEHGDDGAVWLELHPEGVEAPCQRNLTPSEARALAAALVHYAAEVES